jgi:hypothetical protein
VINVDAEFEHVNAAVPAQQVMQRGFGPVACQEFWGADA